MTEVDIISGFLGSGKTTLIKKILKEYNKNNEKVVVIENEFGNIGIDGNLIKEAGVDVVEINDGCICCTIVGQFSASIKKVLDEFNPDKLVIEPSGVGKLSEVLNSCEDFLEEGKVSINAIITVVDVLKYDYNQEYVKEYFEDQISNGKTVFLSRTQRASKELIDKISKEIKTINPQGTIVTTPWDDIESEFLRKLLYKENVEYVKKNIEQDEHEHNHGPSFQTWEVETMRSFKRSEMKAILENLKKGDYGKIFRSKGIVPTKENEWIQFDFVSGEYEIRKYSPLEIGKLVVIGRNLNEEKLEELFNC